MANIKVLDQSTTEVFSFSSDNGDVWWFEVRNTHFGCCILPVTHNICGDRVNFNEDLGMDEVVFTVKEAIGYFERWYNERNDTNFSFCVEEEFENILINQGIDHLKSDVEGKLEYAYETASKNTNTDIIIEKDGTVRSYCYYGSVEYRDSDIVLAYTISPQDKDSFHDMLNENLNDEQKVFVKEKGFLSIWQTSNQDPETWEKFSISDFDWNDTFDEMKRKIDEFETENYDENETWL